MNNHGSLVNDYPLNLLATTVSDLIDYLLVAAAAFLNLLLAAWDKQWISVWFRQDSTLSEGHTECQSGYSVIGILALGYFDVAPPLQPCISVAEKLHQLP